MATTSPYGTWQSPITPEDLVADSVELGEVWVDDDGQVCWLEGRPTEGGRQVVVREGTDLVPHGFNVRTSVHEYGGGAWRMRGHNLFFSNFEDQVVYRVEFGGRTPGPPVPITRDPNHSRGDRYADFEPTKNGRFLLGVRERHSGQPGDGPDGMVEAVNELVAIAVVPAGEGGTLTDPQVLAAGHDFYAAPRLSPDGRRLCWMTWDHPNMPWDGAELWVADLALAGASGLSLRNEVRVAGGPSEAPTQARWLPDGSIVFASDRNNWWNLYCWTGPGDDPTPLCARAAEFAGPQWVFGGSSYCVLPDGRLALTWSEKGSTHLGVIDPNQPGSLREVETPFTAMASLRAVDPKHVALSGASATEFTSVAVVALDDGKVETKRRSRQVPLDPAAISIAEPVEFPTLDGSSTAHGLYYRPTNPAFVGPEDERPPLIVRVHGGPTTAVNATLQLAHQFWTSRGFAVVEVNYGGSSSYGREYRERLNGTWGVVDVEDSYAAAKYLCDRGDADASRIVIRGGSAGGFTTLVAAIRPDLGFAAGCSLYGISDLEVFVRDTHKFESRYVDRLIGRLPESLAVYRERSAMYHAEQISMPLLLLQGQDDKVVPPSQSEVIVETLRKRGTPVAYFAYEGEGHGFRRADSIISAYGAELSFYAQVLGFEPADSIPKLKIENL